MRIKKLVGLIFEYIQLLLKSWWVLLVGLVPDLVDAIYIYVCPHILTRCPDIMPRSLSWFFIGGSFLIANIRVFAEQKKKIESIEEKLNVLEQKIPRLELSFSDNQKSHTFQPTIYTKQPKKKISSETSSVIPSKELPDIFKGVQQAAQALAETARSLPFYQQLQEEAKYKNYLEEWKRKVKSYSKVEIKIRNDSKVPAENIDVYLYFPKEIIPFEELPEKPEASSMFPALNMTPRLTMDFDFWASVNDNVVTLHGKKLKHGHEETFNKFYIRVKDIKQITKKVRYEITADNIPQPQIGTLTFKIEPHHALC